MVSVAHAVGSSRLELDVRGAVIHLTVQEAEKVVAFLSHALGTMPKQERVEQIRNRLQTTYVAG